MLKKITIPVLLLLIMTTLNSHTFIFCKRQGISGHVYLVKGNQMPSPDIKPTLPPPLQTTVYIYELTNTSQVQQASDPAFYTTINTRLVKEVRTNKKGHFKARLNPGQYSLFIKKDNLYYANIYDIKNNIAPVTVEKKKFTEVTIKADYDAVY